jgi:spore coat polysaccharide biosynthesis predicted glycosyltransferase SpsG
LLSLGLGSGDPAPRPDLPAGVTVVAPPRFRQALAEATVAVVAGGTTLYEACALGTPVVAVPVVPGQAAPVRRFVRAGLAVGTGRFRAGAVGSERWGRAAAEAASGLLTDAARRAVLARRGLAAIDGRGAERVAGAIALLLEREMSTTRTTR